MTQENKLPGSIRNWTSCFRSTGLRAFKKGLDISGHSFHSLSSGTGLRSFPKVMPQEPCPLVMSASQALLHFCLQNKASQNERASCPPSPGQEAEALSVLHLQHRYLARPTPQMSTKRLRLTELQVATFSFLPVCS